MEIVKQYVVDAFTDKVFYGNPASVCVLKNWLSDNLMLKIARENNHSETAFIVKKDKNYQLRWFTPAKEVELCGHATLAAAYVIFHFIDQAIKKVDFETLSGKLTVKQENDLLTMDFPTFELTPIAIDDMLIQAIGQQPIEAYKGADIVCVLENEEQIYNAHVNLDMIKQCDGLCFHITAKSKEYDCITRTFAPKCQVKEDPVCGRAHCHVVPLWSKKLNKQQLTAYQASQRGGTLYCQDKGKRVILSGYVALFSSAEIYLEGENNGKNN